MKTRVEEVLKDLSEQTEVAVKDERIPIDREGVTEWFKHLSECVGDDMTIMIDPDLFRMISDGS